MKIPSIPEMQLMAELRDTPGYNLVLENIQAFIDDLGDSLEEATDNESERRRLNLWRVARKILSILRFTPEQFAQEMNAELARMTEEQQLSAEFQRPSDFLTRARLARQARPGSTNLPGPMPQW